MSDRADRSPTDRHVELSLSSARVAAALVLVVSAPLVFGDVLTLTHVLANLELLTWVFR